MVTNGAVDLHFHGAFGIDLMKASHTEMNDLSDRLARAGIAGFCPTTLSAPRPILEEAVSRMGQWIRKGKHAGAIPLGIHLEGPFIAPEACGAHPPGTIRELDFTELEELWEASHRTLKILTVAPETLPGTKLKKLAHWAKARKIVLSLGHSRATEEQARRAFDSGFRNLTHAWNALAFHHRKPGPLGAALGRKDVFVELIIDQVHVAPTLIRWTERLHPQTCYVSDCVPAAATSSGWYGFGPLQIEFRDGACRLKDGSLAGGGLLLTEAFARWITHEAQASGQPAAQLLKSRVAGLSLAPLKSLGISAQLLGNRKAHWRVDSANRLALIPN